MFLFLVFFIDKKWNLQVTDRVEEFEAWDHRMSIEGFHVVGEQDHSRVAVNEETEFLAHKLFLK